jgi:hypothetical protein
MISKRNPCNSYDHKKYVKRLTKSRGFSEFEFTLNFIMNHRRGEAFQFDEAHILMKFTENASPLLPTVASLFCSGKNIRFLQPASEAVSYNFDFTIFLTYSMLGSPDFFRTSTSAF